MGGEGFSQSVKESLKANRKLRRKISIFSKQRSFLNLKSEYTRLAGGEVRLKSLSKEELAEIRGKLEEKRRRENILIVMLIIIGCLIAAYFSYTFMIKGGDSVDYQEAIQNSEEYKFYISDGDYHLELGNWHNAIFQYNMASELFPEDYHARYRIAYAYTYQCRNEKIDCNIAHQKVAGLLEYFPDKLELKELEKVLDEI